MWPILANRYPRTNRAPDHGERDWDRRAPPADSRPVARRGSPFVPKLVDALERRFGRTRRTAWQKGYSVPYFGRALGCEPNTGEIGQRLPGGHPPRLGQFLGSL